VTEERGGVLGSGEVTLGSIGAAWGSFLKAVCWKWENE